MQNTGDVKPSQWNITYANQTKIEILFDLETIDEQEDEKIYIDLSGLS